MYTNSIQEWICVLFSGGFYIVIGLFIYNRLKKDYKNVLDDVEESANIDTAIE
ncbi:MAG: hypothetical protein LBR44_08300 [Clostridiales Family XIII bacterium]|jgi:hypothetical protein|nr:hypothetical protein [Clostridiales Family XIII bacterium]